MCVCVFVLVASIIATHIQVEAPQPATLQWYQDASRRFDFRMHSGNAQILIPTLPACCAANSEPVLHESVGSSVLETTKDPEALHQEVWDLEPK